MTLSTRRGYTFEKEVHNGLDLIPGAMVFKIPDAKSLGQIISIKAPADFIVSVGGIIITVEAKQTKLKRIPWSNFRQHQIDWVLSTPNACFVINFNDRKKINRTFIVHAAELKALMEEFPNSVPMDSFQHELERQTAKHHPTGLGAFIKFK